MITFKQKIYRGENWVNIENFPEIDEFIRLGKAIRVDISERKSFLDDYKKIQSYPSIRKRIKQLRQDIQDGYVYDYKFNYYLDEDGNILEIKNLKELKEKLINSLPNIYYFNF